MAGLLAAKANGKLSRYTSEWCKPWKPPPAVLHRMEELSAPELDAKAEEVEGWLRARVLSGPCQSSLFVKYVLREIVYGSKEGIWVTAGKKVAY